MDALSWDRVLSRDGIQATNCRATESVDLNEATREVIALSLIEMREMECA